MYSIQSYDPNILKFTLPQAPTTPLSAWPWKDISGIVLVLETYTT